MKTYTFDVRVGVSLDIEGATEEEARDKITDYLREYFENTETEVNNEEATLIGVSE